MSTRFRYAAGRDAWERQTGEPAEEFDWFQHWRNDGHRRSYVRTADKFEVTRDRVARVAKRNQWADRLAAWKQHNSRQVQERFEELVEAGLVPFAQAFAKLSAHAVTGPIDKVPADRALTAATNALRVVKEPTVRDLINIRDGGGRDIDLANLILDTLSERFPEAHDAVLDSIEQAADQPEMPGGDG